LWAKEPSSLSHTTAATVLGLDVPEDLAVHVTTPRNLRPPQPWVRVHRRKLARCDVTEVRGQRVTTMPRTIIDLAAVLDEEPLDIALDSAIRMRMSRSRFLERFEEVAKDRPHGIRVLRKLIDERETEQGLTGSAFERRLLRLLRRGGLPLPVCQYEVERRNFKAFIDFAYPEFGIAVEADGYRWHDGRGAFERDRVRTSELGSLGWRVIQVTWLQLKYDPAGVLERIRRALDTPAIVALRPI
jgi:very-short-patch-repair endonuclease